MSVMSDLTGFLLAEALAEHRLVTPVQCRCGWRETDEHGEQWHEHAAASVALVCDGLIQVGWLGPYGLIPGGMDNDPAPHWRPVYVRREDGTDRG